MMRIGRTKTFSTPRIAAAKNALKNPLTWIPFIRYDAIVIAAVKINHLTSSPMRFSPDPEKRC